jgi:MFS family permease
MKTKSQPPGTERSAKIKNVIRVSSGNFLEMYDFIVFGFFAGPIGRTFFPGHNPYASLMLSLATFGAGFLMRPVGAVVLGAYIDRYGRRAGLLLTLALMSVGTITIACLPGYATLGLFATLLILLSRLLQGFSAGVELGGVSVYLAEIATPGHKGFYVSWQSASQAGRGHGRVPSRGRFGVAARAGYDRSLGLAHSFPLRLSDRSASFPSAEVAR